MAISILSHAVHVVIFFFCTSVTAKLNAVILHFFQFPKSDFGLVFVVSCLAFFARSLSVGVCLSLSLPLSEITNLTVS